MNRKIEGLPPIAYIVIHLHSFTFTFIYKSNIENIVILSNLKETPSAR